MNSKIDRKHLRQIALTRFDIQLLSLLMHTGGEYPMPETPEGKAGVEVARSKNLITVIVRYGERARVRLTDKGRIVLEQLETMNSQPKVEVDNR